MSRIVIKAEKIGKRYCIGEIRRYNTLRDTLTDIFYSPCRKVASTLKRVRIEIADEVTDNFIWALKDVSFEIHRGEVVGIIGRNGAGKSTLLKILSRITKPTEGHAEIHGRVGSLLEVGTGFHPELTGRENIYLNGAILGMRKHEIKLRFDEIVSFAEVEKFIDTPVKHYSSGMHVRLAFAVAAHLEPEILLVDEVLAVGDAAFQKKCLGRMEEVGKEGRTILFVSHHMAAVQNLCQRAIWLNQGEVFSEGQTEVVIRKYLEDSAKDVSIPLAERKDRQGTGDIRFISLILQNEKGENIPFLHSGQYVKLVFCFENKIHRDLRNLQLAMGIDNQTGERIALLSSEMTGEGFPMVPANVTRIELEIERLPLNFGRYWFTIYCTINGVVADWIRNAGCVDVEAWDYYGTGKLPPLKQGNFLMSYHFNMSGSE